MARSVNHNQPAMFAFPGWGYPVIGSKWYLHLSGVVCQLPANFNLRQRMMIRMLGGVMKARAEELDGQIFQERIMPFMADAEKRQPVAIRIGDQVINLRRRTGRNGHFQEFITISHHELSDHIHVDDFGNQVVPFEAELDRKSGFQAQGLIYLLNRQGLSVISDIDDTIKDSFVNDRQRLLSNTFLREFQIIEGMADVYRDWSQVGASFHYVSSSPWQLLAPLTEMKVNHQFPLGTLHLRQYRLRDQFFQKMVLRRHGKSTAIRFLLDHWQQRQFLLIGDSGEKDPEIYVKLFRKYPHRIKAVLIRDLHQRPIDSERWRTLQRRCPEGRLQKFKDADQLQELASQWLPSSSADA